MTKQEKVKYIIDELEKNESIDKNLLRYMTVRVKKFDLEAKYFSKKEEYEKKIISLNKENILITQNIDGLHQQSGMNQNQIIEIHGNAKRAACLDCYKINDIQSFHDSINKDLKLPVCSSCGGIVKVATISFGQPMKEEDMMKASDASKACDLMLVIGSSLKVMPAGKIPGLAITSGAKVVILNRDKTRYDSKADVVVNDELENICSELNHLF